MAPPCRYYLAGNCLMNNCAFSHDIPTCTFFGTARGCARGESCRFAHVDAAGDNKDDWQESVYGQSLQRHSSEKVPSESRPAAGAAVAMSAAASGPPFAALPTSSLSSRQRLQAANVRVKTPWVAPEWIAGAVLARAQGVVREDGAVASIVTRYFPAPYWFTSSVAAKAQSSAAAAAATVTKEQQARRAEAAVNEAPPASVDDAGDDDDAWSDLPTWVATGSDVSRLYQRHRAEAIKECIARNRMFAMSTEAYLRGDKVTATKLSKLGKVHAERAKKLHREAMLAIVEQRNATLGKGQLDLHGLHRSEAVVVLQDRLASMKPGQTVNVIVGTGHHTHKSSGNTSARLPSAVRAFLDKASDVRYKEVSQAGDSMGGTFRVTKT